MSAFSRFISMCKWRRDRKGLLASEEKTTKHCWKITLKYVFSQKNRKRNHQNHGRKDCTGRIFRKWSVL